MIAAGGIRFLTGAMLALGLMMPARDAAAQPAPPETPAENWGAPEVVEVQAAPGPAVWHLTRGESEVWILGTVGAMPDDLKWNKDYLDGLIEGARAILMPPRPSIGLLEGAWFLIVHGGELSLPRGQKLEPSLPEPLRDRLSPPAKASTRRPAIMIPTRRCARRSGCSAISATSSTSPATNPATPSGGWRVPIM